MTSWRVVSEPMLPLSRLEREDSLNAVTNA
jgi:hypothetical protein